MIQNHHTSHGYNRIGPVNEVSAIMFFSTCYYGNLTTPCSNGAPNTPITLEIAPVIIGDPKSTLNSALDGISAPYLKEYEYGTRLPETRDVKHFFLEPSSYIFKIRNPFKTFNTSNESYEAP